MGLRHGSLAVSVALFAVIMGIGLAPLGPSAQQARDIGVKGKTDTAQAEQYYGNSWALIIGINGYQHPRVPRLNYAVADAEKVAAVLSDLGFPQENMRVLLDRDATKAQIERVLYEEFAGMGPEDRLLVYFAGHGQTVPLKNQREEAYILPVDADPGVLARTAIPMNDFERIGQRVKAKHVLFVTDACFSGFTISREITPDSVTDDYLRGALEKPVVYVIAAGRKGEKSLEVGGHGIFTRHFLSGLSGAAADPERKGIIAASQLGPWLAQRVTRESKGRMNPQYSKLDGEGEFLFIRPGARLKPLVGDLTVRGLLPGIEVSLNGNPVGTTESGRPLVLENLSPGTYLVMGRKQGYQDWTQTVEVIARQSAQVTIAPQPIPKKAAPEPPKPWRAPPSF